MQFLTHDFNPRSREGSDGVGSAIPPSPAISIHAPAKGATSLWTILSYSLRDFNPRSREGSDGWLASQADMLAISIHAPAKGATELEIDGITQSGFQSTLPRRERPFGRLSVYHPLNFNPRSREGSDWGFDNVLSVFI